MIRIVLRGRRLQEGRGDVLIHEGQGGVWRVGRVRVLEGWWVKVLGGLVVGGQGTFEGLKSWQVIQ